MSKLCQARTLADDWADQAMHAAHEADVSSHFDGCSAHQLIDMWESAKNLRGKPLSQFETQAPGQRQEGGGGPSAEMGPYLINPVPRARIEFSPTFTCICRL